MLLVYLVIGVTGLDNSIFCFSQNGDVKVEFLCSNISENNANISNKQLITSKNNLFATNHCENCTDVPYVLNIKNNNADEDNTIYFYYPLQIKKIKNVLNKTTFFQRLNVNYSKFSLINTSTTRLLN